MKSTRRTFIARAAGIATASAVMGVSGISAVRAQSKKLLHFGVGPLLPTPEDTKKAYMPLFTHLAKELGVDFDLVATTDWAGMAVAMGSGQLDLAWMGPCTRGARMRMPCCWCSGMETPQCSSLTADSDGAEPAPSVRLKPRRLDHRVPNSLVGGQPARHVIG